jgi:hypothetical protein
MAMDKPMIDGLVERLERLEQENRRWRRAAVALGLAGAIGLLVGAARQGGGPKTVEAERFVVKGEDGNVYAELGLYRDERGRATGATSLVFFGEDGKYRTNYGIGSRGAPFLHFMGEDGAERASLSMIGPEEWTQLSFHEKSGKTQVTIGSSNASGVSLWGPGEREGLVRQVGRLLVTEDGSATLSLFRPFLAPGDDVHERVHLGVKPDGSPRLSLRGAEFGGGIRAAVNPDGTVILTDGNPKAQ